MKTTFLIALLLLISSCNNYNHRPIILSKMITNYNRDSLPHGISEYWYCGLGRGWQNFEDSSYKYNIGDTIK